MANQQAGNKHSAPLKGTLFETLESIKQSKEISPSKSADQLLITFPSLATTKNIGQKIPALEKTTGCNLQCKPYLKKNKNCTFLDFERLQEFLHLFCLPRSCYPALQNCDSSVQGTKKYFCQIYLNCGCEIIRY